MKRTFAVSLLRPLVVLGFFAPSVLLAQGRRPMSIDDLLSYVRVADPQLSPDGRRVLFVRTTTAMPAATRNADIWMVPADGSGPPRPFIESAKSDNSPRFIGNGSRVAFISSRDGTPQIYIADTDGKNAKVLTTLSGGVQPPLIVSPDGKLVAFISDVTPSCTDEACNKRMRDAAEQNPVKVHELTRLPYRHWDEWWTTGRHHVFVTDIATGATRDVTPGDFDSPPHNYEDAAIAFSADSREIAFVSKRDGKDSEMWSTNHDVFAVPVTGGNARKITTNPAADFQPVFSPDGKSVVVRAQRRPGFEADRWYLDVYDRASGAKRTVFLAPDLSVEDFRISSDGATIWFTTQENGALSLYTVPFAGGTPKLVTKGGAIGELQLGANFAVYSKSRITAPADIYRVGLDGKAQQLTHENAALLNTIQSSDVESMAVPGAGGTSVQYWIIKPPGFNASRKYPIVFLIHGGPQGAWNDSWSSRWNPALWAAQGWVVAAPNPRGSTGFGQKFVDDISQDWCGKVMTDFDAVFAAVLKQPYADPARTGIAGASYGGYAVDWIISHTDRFKAAVSHDGVFNLESMALATEELWFSEWEFGGPATSAAAKKNFARCSPHLFADKIKTPTLVITNEQDFRVPVDQGLQLFTALRRNGTPSKGLVFPDEGHWVLKPLNSKRWHEEVFEWMHKYLEPGRTQ